MHVTLDDTKASASCREQMVEVTLGPDWAFETGGLGSLTRRVPASQVVTAVLQRNRRAKQPKLPREPWTPPVVETLRKAIEWRRQLDAGKIASQADIARREGVTRARVTQVLMLLRLAPQIQERILNIPRSVNPPSVPERLLRPITRIEDSAEQAGAFERVIDHLS